jgi:hypothetical protein
MLRGFIFFNKVLSGGILPVEGMEKEMKVAGKKELITIFTLFIKHFHCKEVVNHLLKFGVLTELILREILSKAYRLVLRNGMVKEFVRDLKQ